jgi:F0F1-type ATP synthase membrane subunit a
LKLIYILLAAVGVIVWLAVGLFIAKGPQPEIVVPAEALFKLGPLNVTNTLLTSWCVMLFLVIFTFLATRSMKLLPGGFQNFIEAVVSYVFDQVEEIAGEVNGRRFFAVTATFFFFIIAANWAGLLPFFNSIGKTEDVGHEIFHEISSPNPDKLTLTDGKYAETHKFGAAKSEKSGGVVLVKNGAQAIDFTVEKGETPGQALDRYVVFLAHEFADFKPKQDVEITPADPADVQGAFAALGTIDAKGTAANAPRLVSESHAAEGDSESHPIASPTLNQSFSGVSFDESAKMTLVVPYFRSVYSDVNNTLALGLCSFIIVEFWGFQSLGFAYIKKFINFSSPIAAFVGFLELLSEFIRIISFAFRLFGNIFAGEVLVLMLTFLMPFLFVDIIYGLELFVGFIQAAVFALLTLVFAVMAVESHDEEHHEEHHGEEAPAGAALPTGTAQAH